eukprot:TRINITY_DN13048_c0_g1_i1.p1 TRINITY_DN13048_c0_g1~~TRINITY_DN13048_c0_g1_i1.p1  ORF type:complete len:789 (+),score=243.67 TRINITY_DN13048_c0_g1_i1:97-2367(+)
MSPPVLSQEQLGELGAQIGKLQQLGDGQPRFCFQCEEGASRALVLQDIIGGGAYGHVVRAFDRKFQRPVAIKKQAWNIVRHETRRIIRELQVLRHCEHPHLVHLIATYALDCADQQGDGGAQPFDIFITCELMEMPLSQVIRNHAAVWRQNGGRYGVYGADHINWIVYQMMHGLHGLHSAGLVHRDIKPPNLVVREWTSELKICDFGLSRASAAQRNVSHYVVTRFYRAPEIIYGTTTLDPAIDIWAAGCVLAEMLITEPLFQVHSSMVQGSYDGGKASQQLLRLLNRIGKPSADDIEEVKQPNVRSFLSKVGPEHLERKCLQRDLVPYVRSLCKVRPTPGDDNEDDGAAEGQDAEREERRQQGEEQKLERLLQVMDSALRFNPRKRPAARELMNHPCFEDFHEESQVVDCPPFCDVDDAHDGVELGKPALQQQLRALSQLPVPRGECRWWDEESLQDEPAVAAAPSTEAAGTPQSGSDLTGLTQPTRSPLQQLPSPQVPPQVQEKAGAPLGWDPHAGIPPTVMHLVDPVTHQFMCTLSNGSQSSPAVWDSVAAGPYAQSLREAMGACGVCPGDAAHLDKQGLRKVGERFAHHVGLQLGVITRTQQPAPEGAPPPQPLQGTAPAPPQPVMQPPPQSPRGLAESFFAQYAGFLGFPVHRGNAGQVRQTVWRCAGEVRDSRRPELADAMMRNLQVLCPSHPVSTPLGSGAPCEGVDWGDLNQTATAMDEDVWDNSSDAMSGLCPMPDGSAAVTQLASG